jgi:hypothetical protein
MAESLAYLLREGAIFIVFLLWILFLGFRKFQ